MQEYGRLRNAATTPATNKSFVSISFAPSLAPLRSSSSLIGTLSVVKSALNSARELRFTQMSLSVRGTDVCTHTELRFSVRRKAQLKSGTETSITLNDERGNSLLLPRLLPHTAVATRGLFTSMATAAGDNDNNDDDRSGLASLNHFFF